MLWLCLFQFLLSSSSTLPAQIVSGTIGGRAQDRTGAALVDTKITLTNQETGAARETVTNSEGAYLFPALTPGRYRLNAAHPGFKSVAISDIDLQIDQTLRLDLGFEVGELTERVTVEASAVHLKTDNPTIGQVIEGRPITELPLNGRSFMQLAALSAGVTPATATSSEAARIGRPGATTHVGGGRASFNSFLIDGMESRGARFGEIALLPSPDAVREFKIQRNFYSAEYGSNAGVISLAIRGGSNKLHGSLFHFLRNDNLDAPQYFDLGGNKPEFKLNQFGGTIGGPIRRDRTFFFLAYEGKRQRRANQGFGQVPLPAQITGDFSGVSTVVRDPLNNNTPLAGNVIPANRISTVARNFSRYIPAPNVSVPQGNFAGTPSTLDDFNQYHVRIDHTFSSKDSMFGRYSNSVWDIENPGLMPYRGTVLPLNGKNLVFQETHVFGPATVNTLKLGYSRGFLTTGLERAGKLLGTELGLKNLAVSPQDYSLPQMTILGFGSPGAPVSFGHSSNSFRNWTNTYAISDTMSHVRGNHTLSLGIDLRHNRSPQETTNGTNGRFVFNGNYTGLPLADYLIGAYQTASAAYSQVIGDYRYNLTAAFLQDDWRLRPNLSLNLGLRYEHQSPWRERGGSEGVFDFSIPGLRLMRDPGEYGFNIRSPLIQTGGLGDGVFFEQRKNFAPRVGFAYSATGKTVLRGGFGLFYAMNQGNDTIAMSANPGAFVTISLTNTPGRVPRLLDTLFDPPAQASLAAGGLVNFVDRERKTPYLMQWNLNIQRELPSGFLLEIGYVGSVGRQLVGRTDWNAAPLLQSGDPRTLPQRRPYPQWSNIWQFFGGENSNYNALTASLERRFARGFTLLANYTFARSFDTYSSSIDDGSSPHHIPNNRRLDHGLSAFDVRHRLAMSGIWELPLGKGKRYANAGGLAGRLVSGWQINGILQSQTGIPFSILVGGDRSNTGVLASQRPNRIGDGVLPRGSRTPQRWFDTTAYLINPVNTYGNAGRSTVWQDGVISFDGSLFKNNLIGERYNLQFRLEIFNMLNTENFFRPGQSINGANFGVVTAVGAAREIQLALRFVF
ncbi:MAG: TonB-dependent receptor [Acidobacteria bacterium]|nr:TonB-dependent receptor [Acidobacteriota bacterium]